MLTCCRYFKNPLQQYMGALCTVDKCYLPCPHSNLLDCTCLQSGYNYINNDLKPLTHWQDMIVYNYALCHLSIKLSINPM